VEAARRSSAWRALGVGVALTSLWVSILSPSTAWADGAPVAAAAIATDAWPLAYVRRPQTLLAGMLDIELTTGVFRPSDDFNVDPRNGVLYQFHPNLQAGAGLSAGITDRLELDIYIPDILCFDSLEPSGCSPNNRHRGNLGIDYGFLRRARLQAVAEAGFELDHSSPSVFGWYAAIGLKFLAADRLSLSLRLSAGEEIDTPSTLLPSPLYAHLNGGLDVQLTERLLFLVHAEPWAPPADLDEGIALEVYGGLSYTFNHHVQAALSGGVYNALSEPAWYASVPGSFVAASLDFWRY
jgi:hypothetical protein